MKINTNENVHFRLIDVHMEDGIRVELERFFVIKETNKCFWVVSKYAPLWLEFKELKDRKFAKLVSKTSCKRYCYPTIEQAIESFKIRKKRQVEKLELQLEQAKTCRENLSKLDGMKPECFDDFVIGVTDSHHMFCFE